MAERMPVFVVPVLAALLTAAGTVYLLARDLPEEAAEPLEINAQQMRIVMGEGQLVEGRLAVQGDANGFALISSGPVRVEASSWPILDVDLDAAFDVDDPERAPAFFWRTAGDRQGVERITLTGGGPVRLSDASQWDGTVVEMGLLLPHVEGREVTLGGLVLQPESLGARLRLMASGWLAFEPWTQRSINYAFGGSPNQRVWLPAVIAAWVALCWLGCLLVAGRVGQAAWWTMAVVLLAGWLLLDLRWTINGARRAADSVVELRHLDEAARRERAADGHYVAYLRRLEEQFFGDHPVRILLVGDPAEEEFYALRAKYHLLPHSAHVISAVRNSLRVEAPDYVLFLGAFAPRGATPGTAASPRARLEALPLGSQWRERLALVDMDPDGVLFAVQKAP